MKRKYILQVYKYLQGSHSSLGDEKVSWHWQKYNSWNYIVKVKIRLNSVFLDMTFNQLQQ